MLKTRIAFGVIVGKNSGKRSKICANRIHATLTVNQRIGIASIVRAGTSIKLPAACQCPQNHYLARSADVVHYNRVRRH